MTKALIISCSGASNTGTLADRVAREIVMDRSEGVEMLCLPALALGRKNAMNKVQNAQKILVIDGCQAHCAKQILEKAGVDPDACFEISKDFNVKKKMIPETDDETVAEIKSRILQWLRE